ncbi:MAG TPA: GNAT family N-acetyltransferase [Candidatus Aquicultor sp.]|jgi:GNAT superfamily N-acetyltransferase
MQKPTETAFHIRCASQQDAGSLAMLLRDLGWHDHMCKEPFDIAKTRIAHHLELCAKDASHYIVVAEDAGRRVVAYAAAHWLPYLFLEGPEGYVSELFVLESERGKGIGRALLTDIINKSGEIGCSRLMLVNSKDRESYERSFYKKMGWTERPEMTNFILKL